VREDDLPRPIEAYGWSKLEAEEATRRHAGVMPITIVRPSAVYGPRDVDFLNVYKQAAHRLGFYAAPADQQMSIVHVRDLVDAIIAAGESKRALGATYFVGSSEPVTWRQLYEFISGLSDSRFRGVQLPNVALQLAGVVGNGVSALTGRNTLLNGNKMALAKPAYWLCDSTRARVELDWRAGVTLQDGLRETYVWYLNAGWLRASKGRS
jgi:nucleoside-diphosphate-sugar epimerase